MSQMIKDDSAVYHDGTVAVLGWIFKNDYGINRFRSKIGALAAQRIYRLRKGFDPNTGLYEKTPYDES